MDSGNSHLNNTELTHSASQALWVPPQSQKKADQGATLTSVFTQLGQRPSDSLSVRIQLTVWKAKEEPRRPSVLWLVIFSVQFSMIFVSIQERYVKIGAVKMVFAHVVYVTAHQDIQVRTVQKPPVQLTSISTQPITLVVLIVPLAPIKMSSPKLASHATLHVKTVSTSPQSAVHATQQLKTLKSFTTFFVIVNAPLSRVERTKSAMFAMIATIQQLSAGLVLEQQPIAQAA